MKKTWICWETRKLWEMPMIPIFLILCLGFNILMIVGNRIGSDADSYVSYVAGVTQETGGQMGEAFDRALARLSDEGASKEQLIQETMGREDTLDQFDAGRLGDLYIGKFRIQGIAAGFLEQKYRMLDGKVKKLAEEDASMSLAAAGKTKTLTEALFQKMCRAVITEGILLAVLMALYSSGCDKLSRTAPVLYSSRAGRRIQLSKAAAGGLSSAAAYTLLSAGSVLVFACAWKPGPIWEANMSSQFNYVTAFGMKLPFLTWTSFSIAGYLAATLALGLAVVLLFHGLGFAAGLIANSAYRGFLLLLIPAALNFEVMMLAGDSSLWLLYQLIQWSPVALWWFQPLWFTDLGVGAVLPWQECAEAVFCLAAGAGLFWASYRHYLKKDVN